MQVLPAKRQEENCTGMYLKGLKNRNGEYLVSLSKSNNLEIQVIFPISELDRSLFPFESVNNIKITIELLEMDECGKKYHLRMLAKSVSQRSIKF